MDCHKKIFELLRENTALAEDAWPSTNASTHLKTISHLTSQLIELCASERKAVSSTIDTNGDACSPVGRCEGVVKEAGEMVNAGEIKGRAPTHPTLGGEVKEHGGEYFTGCSFSSKSSSIRSSSSNISIKGAGKKYLNFFDKNAPPKERMENLRELFRSFDLNGDGFIDKDEFCQTVTSYLRVSSAVALEYFKEVDRNSSGKISLSDFDKCIEILKIKDPKARFMEIAGADRVIDKKEWRQYCRSHNISFRKGNEIWTKMDTDRSGRVTYQEFDIYVNRKAKGHKNQWFNS